ncbi:flagellar basal-body rod protein FlgF [Pseudoalteromonas sp. SMS1]|uniref:flagellar basal-body rod protein FlgF n=1 Tax=Pseudoalteromonas sp. SMS1 TaxID=2908894 RepID=UPI001F30E32C|nr:flagellar basal-body rod protein FlgF [Pseudoalteromonas sp. SMS1]MCF2860229.1 flagellar basal-body rod protein FlgF [Pseudoalteromonas sp. SMS1]
MLQSFFTGLSGMYSFSRNLDNVSNNISNMNTPGYRGTDTFYKSLTNGDNLNQGGSGYGTQISGLGYRFSTGDIRQTGNATDVAISGQGFFTLMNGNQQFYTRAGQFSFNQDGILIDPASGLNVGALNDQGQLVDFDISGLRTKAPSATSLVELSGVLSSGDTTHEIGGIKVFNNLGEEVELTMTFTKSTDTDRAWNVSVKDANGTELHTGEIRFDTDGTPSADFNSLTVPVSDSHGGVANISFSFGKQGSVSGATSSDLGEDSTLRATVTDGTAMAELQSVEFQSDGALKLTYSDGKTETGPKLALSNFSDTTALKLVEGAIFKADDNSSRVISTAGEGAIGSIAAQSIELSNVDLSREFADMMIIQRGYQASSRILNVSNQLLEQLYENTRGR